MNFFPNFIFLLTLLNVATSMEIPRRDFLSNRAKDLLCDVKIKTTLSREPWNNKEVKYIDRRVFWQVQHLYELDCQSTFPERQIYPHDIR